MWNYKNCSSDSLYECSSFQKKKVAVICLPLFDHFVVVHVHQCDKWPTPFRHSLVEAVLNFGIIIKLCISQIPTSQVWNLILTKYNTSKSWHLHQKTSILLYFFFHFNKWSKLVFSKTVFSDWPSKVLPIFSHYQWLPYLIASPWITQQEGQMSGKTLYP